MKEENQSFKTEHEDSEMTINAVGSPDSIEFHRTDALQKEALEKEALGNEDVIVQVEAVGVNSRDFLLVLDSMPCLGLESSGAIHSVGAGLTDLRPCDLVFLPFKRKNYLRLCCKHWSNSAFRTRFSNQLP